MHILHELMNFMKHQIRQNCLFYSDALHSLHHAWQKRLANHKTDALNFEKSVRDIMAMSRHQLNYSNLAAILCGIAFDKCR